MKLADKNWNYKNVKEAYIIEISGLNDKLTYQ